MGLVTKEVEVKWTSSNRPYWSKKGYLFDGYDKSFKANIFDVSPVLKIKVTVECDYCGEKFESTYDSFRLQYDNKHCNKIPCNNCRELRRKDIQEKIKEDNNKTSVLINDLKMYYNKYGIPSSNISIKKPMFTYTWYVYSACFGGDLVDWLKIAGIKLNDKEIFQTRHRGGKGNFTKEEAIQIILNMQSELNRPLMYDDFRHPNKTSIGISYIKKYWGTMNNMKKELNLDIIQDSMIDKHMSLEEAKEIIFNICNLIYITENRRVIMEKDFKNRKDVCNFDSFRRVFRLNGLNIRDYVNEIGFKIQKSGNGLNYIFEDGEKTVSRNEYEFSNYLRNIGFVYNKDYFRDIRYNEISNTYKGNMNCDYQIHINGKIIYVELAGMLSNSRYEECYKNNISINSKSKEKYRLDLMKKKSIFEEENLEYYILLKSEMNEEVYNKILNNTYQEVV